MIKTVKERNGLSAQLTVPSRVYQRISKVLIRFVPYIPSSERYNLTICHERKFVWFRVAKVGTRTIFNILEQGNINLDAEHAMFCHYPARLYKEYFKFAFVRNPWDRLVSCWQSKVIDSNYFKFSQDTLLEMQTFSNFVDFVANLNIEKCDHHIRLQSKLIDLNNVDFIGRFEKFDEGISKVIQHIGIGAVSISRKNASKNRLVYTQYYNEDLKEKVAAIYRKDIDIFHYEF